MVRDVELSFREYSGLHSVELTLVRVRGEALGAELSLSGLWGITLGDDLELGDLVGVPRSSASCVGVKAQL